MDTTDFIAPNPNLDPHSREAEVSVRPCQFCRANHGEFADAEMCEMAHRSDEPAVYDLARSLARLFQRLDPTDEQIGWFLEDADAILDDFDPPPERWRLRQLPDSDNSEFVARFRVNDITYVIENGEGYITPIRLSTLRQQQREAGYF